MLAPPLALICNLAKRSHEAKPNNQCRYNKQNTKSWRTDDYVYSRTTYYAYGKGLLDIFVIE